MGKKEEEEKESDEEDGTKMMNVKIEFLLRLPSRFLCVLLRSRGGGSCKKREIRAVPRGESH